MRPVSAALAIAGGAALVAAEAIELTIGNPPTAGWLLIGPGPVHAAGLVATLRRPDHPMSTWMLAAGTTFVVEVCLGDAILQEVAGWSLAVALVRAWAGNAVVVAGLGLIGLLRTGAARGGRPSQRRAQRRRTPHVGSPHRGRQLNRCGRSRNCAGIPLFDMMISCAVFGSSGCPAGPTHRHGP